MTDKYSGQYSRIAEYDRMLAEAEPLLRMCMTGGRQTGRTTKLLLALHALKRVHQPVEHILCLVSTPWMAKELKKLAKLLDLDVDHVVFVTPKQAADPHEYMLRGFRFDRVTIDSSCLNFYDLWIAAHRYNKSIIGSKAPHHYTLRHQFAEEIKQWA